MPNQLHMPACACGRALAAERRRWASVVAAACDDFRRQRNCASPFAAGRQRPGRRAGRGGSSPGADQCRDHRWSRPSDDEGFKIAEEAPPRAEEH